MVEVTLVGVRVELPTNQPIVLLKEREGGRFLPIWIGAAEATAIAFALQGVVTQRPMTHDLLKNVIDALGVTVEGIDITELREGTFYALIRMRATARPTRSQPAVRCHRPGGARGHRSSLPRRFSRKRVSACGRTRARKRKSKSFVNSSTRSPRRTSRASRSGYHVGGSKVSTSS